jgi:hypothetical protein
MGSTGKLESLLVLDGTLEALLGCRIGIVEASRLIAASRVTLCQESNPLFIPFVGIDSETDQFPLGEVRELWAPDALVRYDQERELAEQHFRSFAMQSANALLAWVRAQEF